MKPVLHKIVMTTYLVKTSDLNEFVKDCTWKDYDSTVEFTCDNDCGCYEEYLHGSCGCSGEVLEYSVSGELDPDDQKVWDEFKSTGDYSYCHNCITLDGLCKDGWLEPGHYILSI